jgi:hypothetical protein
VDDARGDGTMDGDALDLRGAPERGAGAGGDRDPADMAIWDPDESIGAAID